jgi:solute carrier family 44 (choline transporter-like protein), member 2/4/5
MVLCCKSRVEDVPDETHGPKLFRQRGCTDLLCLLLFLVFWSGTFYITYLSIHVGKPWSVLYGADYLGNRCGRGEFSDRPKTYYPRIDQDLLYQADIALSYPWRLSFYGLCVEQCPNVSDANTCFANPDSCRVYDYGPDSEREAEFYYATLPSVSIINRCIPT